MPELPEVDPSTIHSNYLNRLIQSIAHSGLGAGQGTIIKEEYA